MKCKNFEFVKFLAILSRNLSNQSWIFFHPLFCSIWWSKINMWKLNWFLVALVIISFHNQGWHLISHTCPNVIPQIIFIKILTLIPILKIWLALLSFLHSTRNISNLCLQVNHVWWKLQPSQLEKENQEWILDYFKNAFQFKTTFKNSITTQKIETPHNHFVYLKLQISTHLFKPKYASHVDPYHKLYGLTIRTTHG